MIKKKSSWKSRRFQPEKRGFLVPLPSNIEVKTIKMIPPNKFLINDEYEYILRDKRMEYTTPVYAEVEDELVQITHLNHLIIPPPTEKYTEPKFNIKQLRPSQHPLSDLGNLK